MATGKSMTAGLFVVAGFFCAALFSQSFVIQKAHAQGSTTEILDNDGKIAGQLEIICEDINDIPGECGRAESVTVRYLAVEGRDLEIRDDLDCPACLNGPAGFQAPSGDNYLCTEIEYPVLVPSGSTFDVSAESCGVPFPMASGPWVFLSDVVGVEKPVIAFFDVSFFVLPESPVGVVAMTGSSLAVLGGFFYFRQRRNRMMTEF
jgi:hypothetical protein